jgi:hypothetical protein
VSNPQWLKKHSDYLKNVEISVALPFIVFALRVTEGVPLDIGVSVATLRLELEHHKVSCEETSQLEIEERLC